MRRYLCNCEMGEWPYQSHNITSTRISALTNCFNLSSFLQCFLFPGPARRHYIKISHRKSSEKDKRSPATTFHVLEEEIEFLFLFQVQIQYKHFCL